MEEVFDGIMGELTDQKFWNKYWKKSEKIGNVSWDFSFERCLIKLFKKELPKNSKESLFEIGCAPGRWLVFFNKNMGYNVHGLDNSKKGVEITATQLKANGIEGGLHQADVMNYKSHLQYDNVISLGFIEHFTGEELQKVIETHIRLVKNGGRLIIGVPNFRGINEAIQKRADEYILKSHNLGIMNSGFFQQIADRYSLKKRYIGYLGSFEPTLFIFKNNPGLITRIVLKGFRIMRKIEFFDSLNSPFFSSYLIAIYEKPGS